MPRRSSDERSHGAGPPSVCDPPRVVDEDASDAAPFSDGGIRPRPPTCDMRRVTSATVHALVMEDPPSSSSGPGRGEASERCPSPPTRIAVAGRPHRHPGAPPVCRPGGDCSPDAPSSPRPRDQHRADSPNGPSMTLLSIYAEKKVCIRSANGNDHLVIAIVSGVQYIVLSPRISQQLSSSRACSDHTQHETLSGFFLSYSHYTLSCARLVIICASTSPRLDVVPSRLPPPPSSSLLIIYRPSFG